MLAEGRKPRNHGERMIANNYATMRRILELKDHPLTPEIVFRIHPGKSLKMPWTSRMAPGGFADQTEVVDVSDP